MVAARYREIAEDLRRRIERGEWPPGETIPRMVELALEYQAARGSVAAAVRLLEADGLVKSTPRRGTVVLEPRPRRRIARGNRVHRRRDRGYSFAATAPDEPAWIHHITPACSAEPITDRAAGLLGVQAGSPVVRRRRVTSPEGEPPFALSDSWIHPQVAEAAPEVVEQGPPGAWLDEIEMAGHGPLSWHEITRARMPSRDEATTLGIPPGLPVLEICRVGVSARTDTPAEVTVMIIPSDRIETVAELERDESARYEVLSPPDGPHSIKEP